MEKWLKSVNVEHRNIASIMHFDAILQAQSHDCGFVGISANSTSLQETKNIGYLNF